MPRKVFTSEIKKICKSNFTWVPKFFNMGLEIPDTVLPCIRTAPQSSSDFVMLPVEAKFLLN